jgi:MFS family permease
VRSEVKAALAVGAMFFANGAIFASWASRIPSIQSQLSLQADQLGAAMFTMGIGSLVSMPITGKLAGKFGSRLVTVVSLLFFCLSLLLIPAVRDFWQLCLALFMFGACGSALDVAMNAHAVAVQRQVGQTIMSRLHALWSVGGMFGAAVGAFMAKTQTAPRLHYLFIAAFFVMLAATAQRLMLSQSAEMAQRSPVEESGVDGVVVREGQQRTAVILLCAICFLGFMCEGSVADWSALYMINSLHTDAAFAAVGYSAFSLAMALGRFGGDFLISTLGSKNLLRYGSFLNACVIVVMLLIARPWWALWGFGITGIGLCTLGPIVYGSVANLSPKQAASAIAKVATAGYVGVLIGPPLLGLTAQYLGFAAPFWAVAGISFFIFILSGLTNFTAGASNSDLAITLEQQTRSTT